MAILRTIIVITIIAAAHTLTAAAQVVNVDGHPGLIDNTTRRILVCNPNIDATLPATIQHDGTTYDVCTTTLPLVHLDHDILTSEQFRPGTLTLIDPEAKAEEPHFTCPVELRYRGATALKYDKKNYAVKLLDPNTIHNADGPQPLDAPLLGMRSDNSWILDAMASDMARMRNRVSTDFWLDFSTPPYYADQEPLMVNGTHGRFVEVFLADRYWGIYCLTEKIDRKQLKLKKHRDGTPRGLLYKSYEWDNLHSIKEPCPNPQAYTWQGWECAYPDNRKGEPFDWEPLLDIVRFLCITSPDFDLIDSLHLKIDVNLWRDYNLFCDLLKADDNTNKNMYVYFRDITSEATTHYYDGTNKNAPPPGPLCICPWDLDATWGRTYDRKPIPPTENCNVSNAVNYHLWLSVPNKYTNLYNERWAQLRQEAFKPENIWTYFERYFNLFATSGADARETERWDGINDVHLDFKAEADFIRNWIPQRIYYLDGDYEYANTAIAPIKTTNSTPNTNVYTLDGRIAAQCPADTTPHTLNLPNGVYIYNHRKLVIQ